MNQFAITALGDDKPGIVAAMSRALHNASMSIEDSSMTILGGKFAMLLLVEAEKDEAAVRSVLQPLANELGMLLDVQTAQRRNFSDTDRIDYVVAAYGPDQPGLVAALSKVLADHEVNITDFGSRVGSEQMRSAAPDNQGSTEPNDQGRASHVFAMWFNVNLPAGMEPAELERALQAAAQTVELDVRLHKAETVEL